jgi:hypothetical protein
MTHKLLSFGVAMAMIVVGSTRAAEMGRVTVTNELTEPSADLVVEIYVKKDNGNPQKMRGTIGKGQTKLFAVPVGSHQIQFSRVSLKNAEGKATRPVVVRVKQELSLSEQGDEKSYTMTESMLKQGGGGGTKKKKK